MTDKMEAESYGHDNLLIHGLSGEFKAMAKPKQKLHLSEKVNCLDARKAGRYVNLPRVIWGAACLLPLTLPLLAKGQQLETSPAALNPIANPSNPRTLTAFGDQLNSIPVIPATSRARREAPEFQFQSEQKAGKFRETGISQQDDFFATETPVFESFPQLDSDSPTPLSTQKPLERAIGPSPSPFLPSIQSVSPKSSGGITSAAPSNDANGPDDDTIVQRFPDGTPSIIRKVQLDENGNYRNQGAWESFDKTGQIITKGNYNEGKMDGSWSRIHAADSGGLFETKPFNLFKGPFLSVAQFKNGQLNGMWSIYDQFGLKIFEINYKQGIRDGSANWFYPNSAKMRVATFKSGYLDGDVIEFNEAEQILDQQRYVVGRPIIRNSTFYRPNVKKTVDYFLGPQNKPQAKDNWWAAQPAVYRTLGSQIQDGSAMSWFENGQPKKRGQFNSGQPSGQFVWWHENGNKQTEGTYENGKKSERWVWWYENGMKRIEGTYQNDQPIRLWRAWNEDGSLETEKDYANLRPPISSTNGEPSVEGTDIEIAPNSLPSPKQEESESKLELIELLPPPKDELPNVIEEIELGDTLELASPQTDNPPNNAETIK